MIPSDQNHFNTSAITDPGSKGRINEDAFQISSFKISENDDTPVLLSVVADGIGGHKADVFEAGFGDGVQSDAVVVFIPGAGVTADLPGLGGLRNPG